MIGKVTRGSDARGLLRYLFGPGRHDEHVDQHLVAGWDREGFEQLQPSRTAAGGFDLRHLGDQLDAPVRIAGRNWDRAVWHCSLRAAPEDPELSDDQWRQVAEDVMARTGLDTGVGDGVRWVAVRHAGDHVHIVATLANQDGTRAEPHNDYYRVAEACQAAEQRWGLRSTSPADRTAGKKPTRAEMEKAKRDRGLAEPERVTLRREVRDAAASAESPEEFFAALEDRGLVVRKRMSQRNEGQVTGYAVRLPDERADGDEQVQGARSTEPAWFGGSKLAPELSWTKLQQRWTDPEVAAEESGWRELAEEIDQIDVADATDVETLGAATIAAMQQLDVRTGQQLNNDVERACRRAWGASKSLEASHRRVLRAAQSAGRSSRTNPDALRSVKTIVRLLLELQRQREAQARLGQAKAAAAAATQLQRLVTAGGRYAVPRPAHSRSLPPQRRTP